MKTQGQSIFRELCECPFDNSHKMPRESLLRHINKYYKECPFNVLHYFKKGADYERHLKQCPDRFQGQNFSSWEDEGYILERDPPSNQFETERNSQEDDNLLKGLVNGLTIDDEEVRKVRQEAKRQSINDESKEEVEFLSFYTVQEKPRNQYKIKPRGEIPIPNKATMHQREEFSGYFEQISPRLNRQSGKNMGNCLFNNQYPNRGNELIPLQDIEHFGQTEQKSQSELSLYFNQQFQSYPLVNHAQHIQSNTIGGGYFVAENGTRISAGNAMMNFHPVVQHSRHEWEENEEEIWETQQFVEKHAKKQKKEKKEKKEKKQKKSKKKKSLSDSESDKDDRAHKKKKKSKKQKREHSDSD